jgi:Ca2+/Na+ antiporter
MSTHENKKILIDAVMGALIVSSFITIESDAFLFAITYVLFEGFVRNIAFILLGLVSVAFFLWFAHHAYWVQQEQQYYDDNTLA